MISPRRRAREMALKALYLSEMLKVSPLDGLTTILNETFYQPAFELFARNFVKSSNAKEVKTGEVGEFISDFSESISNTQKFTKSEVRALVLTILERHFSGLTAPENDKEQIRLLIERTYEKKQKSLPIERFSRELIASLEKNHEEINKTIDKTAKNWSLERMSIIDRSILKTSACELFYFPDIPSSATINEAIELAKKYSAERSYEFVNGILDKLCKEHNPPKNNQEAKQGTT